MLKIAFDKIYKHPLDENHRFPMIKYDLIPEQLLRENTCNHENFFKPLSLKDSDVLLTHDEDYYHRFSFGYNLCLKKKARTFLLHLRFQLNSCCLELILLFH